MRRRPWDTDPATIRFWDSVILFWVVLWLVVGAWTGYEIWQLTGLSASTVDAGHALATAGKALQDLRGTPIVGARTGELGSQVSATASGIIVSGHSANESIRGLSILIGLAVALGPAGPALLIHLPRRRALSREIADVDRALRTQGADQTLLAHLAYRAMSSHGLAELLKISPDPAADLAAGRYDALAAAELHRLGLRPPSQPGP